MIIEHEQKNEVIQGGNVPMEEKAMRIKASAKAFKVLSDSLYSDKIFAIIREVGGNAQDANVDAGKPNEPSTKTDASKQSSYDSTGMLGLGCKSPLAYTDSFVVESFIDGVKNAYSIYKNEHGIPSCVRMSSEPTDEQNGLKVTIPVGSNDFSNFANKAKGVFKHFKNRPKITGNDITVPEKDYYLENEYFGLRTKDWDNGKAIMGNISYPLDDLSDDSLTSVVLS